jgi:hypothetical protein
MAKMNNAAETNGASMQATLAQVGTYYTSKLLAHGATPQGVDWNTADSQNLRFEQFARLWPGRTEFSIIDLGCGYGALLDYLASNGLRVDYLGLDISAEMIREARLRHAQSARASFVCSAELGGRADYVVASGIFNVKLDAPEPVWREHTVATVEAMNRAAIRGIAFNCLTRYSDADKMRSDLFYADPSWLFDYCKRRFARNVALLHDYGLYEFTLVVRKDVA